MTHNQVCEDELGHINVKLNVDVQADIHTALQSPNSNFQMHDRIC